MTKYKNIPLILILLFICIVINNLYFSKIITVLANTNKGNLYIANVVNSDVKSEVYLTYNDYTDSKIYKTNIKIVVKTDGDIIEIPTNNLGGYDPTLFLGDFLGNGLDQIMLTVSSGGSGGFSYIYIYSVKNGVVNEIFNIDKFNAQVTFKTEVIDNIVKVTEKNNIILLDISGKEKSEMETYVSSVNTIFPVYNTFFNKYYLLTLNKVIGGYQANNYGYITCFVELDGGNAYLLHSQGILNNFA